MMKLYDYPDSGNSYKLQLLLAQLEQEYELVVLDIRRGASRTNEFKKTNPFGKVPTLVLDDGRTLWESNAIMAYLAEGSEFVPSDPFLKSKVLQWMFFEQHAHEPYIAELRFLKRHFEWNDDLEEKSKALYENGYLALDQMERHLTENDYFVANTYSIADIALYAYTHVADQGGFSLETYPEIKNWIKRIEALPNFIPMKAEIL